ncbi:hypothetical protein M1O29_03240 [Dehalococcoidia bacterium]|nr:hypothetical protein [Dehalococcoidia bacterium]
MNEYITDASAVPPRGVQRPYVFPGWPNGVVIQSQTLLSGENNGPWGTCTSFPENTGSQAHFHTSSQFQFVISGSMDFPDHHLEAPAVHYTDHCVPYGPFTVSEDHAMVILRPRLNRQIFVTDPKIRELVNREGRTFVRNASDVEWEPDSLNDGARRKILVPDVAEIVECPAGMEFRSGPAKWGQYQVVFEGTVVIEGKDLKHRSLRFVRGDESPSPLKCGAEGATLIVLTFGEDSEWLDPEPSTASAS